MTQEFVVLIPSLVILSARLCENSTGALRLSSGRTDKYLIPIALIPFVVSLVEP